MSLQPDPELPVSRSLVPRVEWLSATESTNSALVEAASGPGAADWPDLSVLVTDDQTAGRGRLGRVWVAPAGRMLATSVLLRPVLPSGLPLSFETLGWVPLVAGLAMTRAVRSFVDDKTAGRVTVKWPNDVLIGGDKVSGILSELVPGTHAVVVGAGLNLFLTRDELPVPTATSLVLAGATAFAVDDVLAAYLAEFTFLYRMLLENEGDAVRSGIAAAVTENCGTIGQQVRVELPGDRVVTGLASGLDRTGRLIVDLEGEAEPLVVSAGDVTHLRY